MYFLSCTLAAVCTCTCYVRASTTTGTCLYYDSCARLHRLVYMYVHVCDQNENATYALTTWVPTVRHFLVCEDVAGGSQQSGGRIFFYPDALPCTQRCSWWIPAVRGANRFFAWTHFRACEDVAGGSQQTGANHFFCPDALPCVRRCSWWVPAVREKRFFCEIQCPV